MGFCTVPIQQYPLPHKRPGVARVAAVFGSTSGWLSASANFISSSHSPAAVPGAHHHAVAQSPLIGSALINSVRHPFLDSSVLLNSPLCSLSSPPLTICLLLLPLAAVAWSSFRQSIGNSLPLYSPLLSSQLFSLSNLRSGSICLVFGISSFAIHVLSSLLFSIFLVYLSDLGSECLF